MPQELSDRPTAEALYGREKTSTAYSDYTHDSEEPRLASTNEMLVEALLHEHGDYSEMKSRWQKYIDLYCSDDIYRFLRKHTRETQDTWLGRVARAYFYNYCQSIVDLFVEYMFSTNITRQVDNKALASQLDEFYQDANLRGTDYVVMMNQIGTFSQIFGHVGVLVDAPRESDDVIVTEQDRIDSGIRPFLSIVTPLQILDWDMDRFGKFNWVKIEVPVQQDRTFRDIPSEMERHFLIWDREGWQLWQVKEADPTEVEPDLPSPQLEAHMLDEGTSPVGVQGIVPLAIIKNRPKPNHNWFGESAIKDIADINIALMNWSSFGDEEIANRCLNILVAEKEHEGDANINLSHHNVLEYTGDTPPQYLVPGDTPLKLIGEWIDRAKDEIYRLAKLGGSTGLLGVREATSGIAYAYEFNETNQSLSNKAFYLEAGEREIHKILGKWLGNEFEGAISYTRDFGVSDFLLELDILLKAREVLSSETAIKRVEKNLSSKLFSGESAEFKAKVDSEIERAEAKGFYPANLNISGFDLASEELVKESLAVGGGGQSSQESGTPPEAE